MGEVHERLAYYIDYKGYSLKEFCQKFDFVYNTFTQIVKGTRPLGIQILNKIVSSLPDLNVDWLLYNRGNMELSKGATLPQLSEPRAFYGEDPFKKMLLTYFEDEDVKEKMKEILKK